MPEQYTGLFSALATTISTITVANSNTETRLVGANLPIEFLAPGTTFRILAFGTLSTKIIPVGVVTWRLRIGSTTLTGNIVTSIVPATGFNLVNQSWDAEFLVTIRTNGGSGTVIGNGSVIGNIGSVNGFLYTGSATSTPVAVNTTIQNVLELTFQFATANAANILNCYNASIHRVKL
jgi:hypothetical protein